MLKSSVPLKWGKQRRYNEDRLDLMYQIPSPSRLELIDLVLGVTQLLQDAAQLTLVGGADLSAANGFVQARRATDKDLDVLALGVRDQSLEQVLGDEALSMLPALGRLVERVVGAESLGELVLNLLELFLQQDVLLADIAEDERDFGLVLGVIEDGADELVHWGDTRAAGD